MNLEHIRKRVRNGFRPFTIRLSDGRELPVPHPEFIMIGKNVVVVMGKDDVARVIDALHIVSIDDKVRRRRKPPSPRGGRQS